MSVHFIYRAAPGLGKNRPPGFSKAVCLDSFLTALECARHASVTFLVDGPIPSAAEDEMREAGPILHLGGVGNSGSYLRAIDLAAGSGDPRDLVYFVEDDYWHQDHAAAALDAVSADVELGDYVTLYDHPDRYRRADDARVDGAPLVLLGGRHWRAVESCTMTFGAARDTVRSDRVALRAAARFTRYPHDRAMWRWLQGLGPRRPVRWARGRRRLLGAVPALQTHVELDGLAPVVDWDAVVPPGSEPQRARLRSVRGEW